MIFKLMYLLVMAIFLNSCATTEWVWDKQGATRQDFYMDQGMCKAQGIQGTMGMVNMGTFMIMNACMQGKGWYQIEQPIPGTTRSTSSSQPAPQNEGP